MTTPYIMKTLNPVWESSVEFFVQDYTKVNKVNLYHTQSSFRKECMSMTNDLIEFQSPLSFYVYDWDGSNVIDDDFLGAAHFCFKEVRNLHNMFM